MHIETTREAFSLLFKEKGKRLQLSHFSIELAEHATTYNYVNHVLGVTGKVVDNFNGTKPQYFLADINA
jgi:hypothetical protein